MNSKVLFVATVDFHFQSFHLPYFKWFKDQGWEVHVAASGEMKLPYVDKKYNIPIQRSPLKKLNVMAYRQLCEILSSEYFDLIHCHTPMGGVLTRLAAKQTRKQGTKVLYTAHGFHFCKGVPIQNWILYYPIERLLSRITDCLITINEEDFIRASKHRFKSGLIKHVHGIGVNTEVYKPIDRGHREILRNKFGYHKDQFLMFYAAEFNKNKNQKLLIESIALIKDTVPNAKLLLAGDGVLLEDCKQFASKLGVKDMVDFLGYRKEIEWFCKMSDVAVASSLREGLPVNIMESMASGLPVIAMNNRGHRELIIDNYNGWVIEKNNVQEFSSKMKQLAMDRSLRNEFGINGRNLILSKYSLQKVLEEKKEIYKHYMNGGQVVSWLVH